MPFDDDDFPDDFDDVDESSFEDFGDALSEYGYGDNEINHIYLEIDSDGMVDVSLELESGEIVDLGAMDSDFVWDELYYWAEEHDVEIDKETAY